MTSTSVTRWALVLAAIALVSAAYYASQDRLPWVHSFLQHMYFAPVAAAAIQSGWRGGVAAAVLAALAYAPHLLIELHEGTDAGRFVGSEATEVVDFVVVGVVAGVLADRERRQKEFLQRTTSR